MASRQNTVLNKGEDDYACIISKIKRSTFGLKCKLNNNEFHGLSAYKFRNAESRRMLHLNFLTNFYHSPDQQRSYEIKSALAYKGRLRDPIINNSVAREIVNL